MNKPNLKKLLALLALSSLLIACGEAESPGNVAGSDETTAVGTGRWYSQQQLDNGAQVFATNCSVCHGDQAQGLTADWRSRQANGSFPPPPLNGSAHAENRMAMKVEPRNEVNTMLSTLRCWTMWD